MNGILYFLPKPDPERPIEDQYVVEIGDLRNSFTKQEDAILFLYDNGVKKFTYLTKPISEYKNLKTVKVFEIWHIENRIGYVLYDSQTYHDENGELQKGKAYVWRFVGNGRSCFAKTQAELKEKVLSLIHEYKDDPEERGYNIYPFYTRYYR